MNTYEQALSHRAKCLREFACSHPELCDESGVAFWPIPVIMPLFFSQCLNLLQQEIVKLYVDNMREPANRLTEVRNLLAKLATEGDLGEDHASLYVADHPLLPQSFDDSHFLPHYQEVLVLNNPFKILGFLYSIEVGSLEFVKALVETGLIKKNGYFASTHLKVEVEHSNLAVLIRGIVMNETFCLRYRSDFVFGCEFHDIVYERIADS
ncbi:MAG: hypothetical protein R3B60_01930 [Candidatus Paceibacterota bacterium]